MKQMGTSSTATASEDSVPAGPSVKTFRDQLRAHRKQADPKPETEAASAASAGPMRPGAMKVVAPLVPKHIPPTEPKPFRFATDERIKQKPADAGSQVNFSKMLRSYQPSSRAAVSF